MPFSADSAWERSRKFAPFPTQLHDYYKDILRQYEAVYNTAEKAKAKGVDSNEYVESKTVFNLADRVNQMLGLSQFEGLGERLEDLLKLTSKETTALTIAQEIALGKFGTINTETALEYSVRAGLAVITDCVTVAPIQGIYSVSIKKNDDNSNYASISYAGPMRSAGGTEAALSLVIADFVASKLGLSKYRAREEEIGRYIEELRVYEREVGNFQYRVSDDDIRLAISNLGIEIDGVETDPVEVVVHRNLSRVSTDRVRGGALRVLNDGVIGRAHKLAKILRGLNITGWEWLSELKGGKQESADETEQTGAHFEEVISGRAVLSSHKAKGGFRVRYGRAVNTGLSTVGIHPAVAAILDYPVVVGTQVKVDLPGKAATIAFVDSIEGPTVLLRDGSVQRIATTLEAEELHDQIARIIDLGDALIAFGDFLENNKTISPSPYVEEWWILELQSTIANPSDKLERLSTSGITENRLRELSTQVSSRPSAAEALTLSEMLKIPLHPAYCYRFDRLTLPQLLQLRNAMTVRTHDIIINITSHHVEASLQELMVPYKRIDNTAIITGEAALIIRRLLNLEGELNDANTYQNPLELIRAVSAIAVRPQTTATIGMRVGRPEKAMLRHLKPPVHLLFPVGSAGGITRDLLVAARQETITVDIANIICPLCEKRRLSARCEECGEPTTRFLSCPRCSQVLSESSNGLCPKCKEAGVTHSNHNINLRSKLELVLQKIAVNAKTPVKGVRGLTSETKLTELIEKGVLRSKHGIYVYKDGTCRIDLTNAPLTHFRPDDIRIGLEKLKSLGYETDASGKPITATNQLMDLKPQDLIIPANVADDLVRIANFVDEELTSIYHLDPLYQLKEPNDLIGKMIVGLAPHTSMGVIGRIIGFTNAQVCFANPCWHAAKRRDCDGDGDSLLLLGDVLLNFSAEYLPNQIGGLMDTPLLIQPIILPNEVDDQAHNFDIAWHYPIRFYELSQNSLNPSTMIDFIERIGSRLGREEQFYGYGYTNTTSAITVKRSRSAYPTLNTLSEKISKQIEVAHKIQAVSAKEVVESIIKTHLLRDIMGNMKKYSTQSFRCKKCGRTYRRPSVSGRCDFCGEELRKTLSIGSVEKYVALARKLAEDYGVDDYVKNRLELAVKELDQLFRQRDKSTQSELTDFSVFNP